MLITPYYNRVGLASSPTSPAPSTRRGRLPLIAYTMPAMAGSQWPLDVLRSSPPRASSSGVKESGEEVGRFLQILDRCPPGSPPSAVRRRCSTVTLAGGHGGILAVANVAPERCLAVYEAAAAGEGRRAAELFAPLVPLLGAIRAAGPSPTGMRAAAAMRYGIGSATRRPLAPVADDTGIRAGSSRRLTRVSLNLAGMRRRRRRRSASARDANSAVVVAQDARLEIFTTSPVCGASTKLPPPMYSHVVEPVEEDEIARRESGLRGDVRARGPERAREVRQAADAGLGVGPGDEARAVEAARRAPPQTYGVPSSPSAPLPAASPTVEGAGNATETPGIAERRSCCSRRRCR